MLIRGHGAPSGIFSESRGLSSAHGQPVFPGGAGGRASRVEMRKRKASLFGRGFNAERFFPRFQDFFIQLHIPSGLNFQGEFPFDFFPGTAGQCLPPLRIRDHPIDSPRQFLRTKRRRSVSIFLMLNDVPEPRIVKRNHRSAASQGLYGSLSESLLLRRNNHYIPR